MKQTSQSATEVILIECNAGIATSVQTPAPPVLSSSSPYYTTVGSRPLPAWAATGFLLVQIHLNTAILTADNSSVDSIDTVAFKQPPEFKESRKRVNKVVGDVKEDFEVWLTSYYEVMELCGWTDQLRAHSFSWF